MTFIFRCPEHGERRRPRIVSGGSFVCDVRDLDSPMSSYACSSQVVSVYETDEGVVRTSREVYPSLCEEAS